MMVIYKTFRTYAEAADWIHDLMQNKIRIEIRGTREFIDRLFERSQALCPYLTGLLQSTGRYSEVGPNTWVIEYGGIHGCNYAGHVYYGHRTRSGTYVPGRPWVEWAYLEMRGEWAQTQAENLGRI